MWTTPGRGTAQIGLWKLRALHPGVRIIKQSQGHLRGLADKMLLAAANSKHSAANTPCSGCPSKPPLKCKFLKHHRSVTFSRSPQMLVVAQKRRFGERGELSAASVSASPMLGSLLLQ